LLNLVLLTESISESVLIQEDLISSNLEYEALSQLERETQITDLNDEWADNDSLVYPLVYERMNNDVANYLNDQSDNMPELFGEIFLTNEYGVMISSTGKLTTLAHHDKYWWEASYNNGEGLIFLDDRGFDASVGGYVLGIVVPIMDNDNKIIGILKVNYNILSILTNKIESYQHIAESGEYSIVRSLGLVVSKNEIDPLSVSVEDVILPYLLEDELIVEIIDIDSKRSFLGVIPLGITRGSESIEFGGNYSSIDHVGGNIGEGWVLVYTISTAAAFDQEYTVLKTLIYASLVLIVIISVISIYLGLVFSKPIVELSRFTEKIGKGDFSARLEKTTNDEVGDLTVSFNEMIENLQNTIITKDVLQKEIAEKHILEEKLLEMSQIDELTNIYNRRAFNEYFSKYYEKAIRYGEDLALIMFDIDDFKLVNDKYGHLIGDKVLIEIAKKVSIGLRKSDIFARWGGEEFVILLTNIPKEKVMEFAERIRKKVSKIKIADIGVITVSLGICLIDEKLKKDKMLLNVDKAMYKAKELGKNQIFIQE